MAGPHTWHLSSGFYTAPPTSASLSPCMALPGTIQVRLEESVPQDRAGGQILFEAWFVIQNWSSTLIFLKESTLGSYYLTISFGPSIGVQCVCVCGMYECLHVCCRCVGTGICMCTGQMLSAVFLPSCSPPYIKVVSLTWMQSLLTWII